MSTAEMQQGDDGAPPMASTPGGIFCLVHGVMDCSEPWCWKCGNHEMDDFGRCADPRCRATVGGGTDLVPVIVAETKRRWALWYAHPCPVELIAYEIGFALHWYATREGEERSTLGALGSPPSGKGSADVLGGSLLPSAEPEP